MSNSTKIQEIYDSLVSIGTINVYNYPADPKYITLPAVEFRVMDGDNTSEYANGSSQIIQIDVVLTLLVETSRDDESIKLATQKTLADNVDSVLAVTGVKQQGKEHKFAGIFSDGTHIYGSQIKGIY